MELWYQPLAKSMSSTCIWRSSRASSFFCLSSSVSPDSRMTLMSSSITLMGSWASKLWKAFSKNCLLWKGSKIKNLAYLINLFSINQRINHWICKRVCHETADHGIHNFLIRHRYSLKLQGQWLFLNTGFPKHAGLYVIMLDSYALLPTVTSRWLAIQ